MIFYGESAEQWRKRVLSWQPYFAWKPKRLTDGSGRSVWLQTIERRALEYSLDDGYGPLIYEYRLPPEND